MSEPGERRRRREMERTGTHRALTPEDLEPTAPPAVTGPPAPGSRRARRAELTSPPTTPVPVAEQDTTPRAHEHRAAEAGAGPSSPAPSPSSPAPSSTGVPTRAVPRVTPGVPPVGPSTRPARAVRAGDPGAVPRPVPAHPESARPRSEVPADGRDRQEQIPAARSFDAPARPVPPPSPEQPARPSSDEPTGWAPTPDGEVPTPTWWAQAVRPQPLGEPTAPPARPRWAPAAAASSTPAAGASSAPPAAVPGTSAAPVAPAPSPAATGRPVFLPPVPPRGAPAGLDTDDEEPLVPAWVPTAAVDPVAVGAVPVEPDERDEDESHGRSYTWLHLVVLALVAFVLGVLIWLLMDRARTDAAAFEPVGPDGAVLTQSVTRAESGL